MPPTSLTPYEQAAHLWRRAGFGATAREVHETVERGIDRTLDEILAGLDRDDADLESALESFAGDAFDLNSNVEDVRAWWCYRMLHAQSPLREKLTLFWHGHFATGAAKVDRAGWMFEQNRLLRRLATASFREMLDGVSKDPAMLVWLDGNTNRKGKPNENYARELFELFSLGIGPYSEKDVQDSARAFTGWNLGEGAFRFDARQHDGGAKRVLDVAGNLDGRDVLDLAATHPATSRHLAQRLCRFFVNDEPDAEYVERVAQAYRRSAGNLRATVEALFRDPAFFDDANYRAVVKSPAEMTIGALRICGVRLPLRDVMNAQRRMGQTLLAPPTVKGWDGGASWLTSVALFERANFALRVASTRGLRDEPRFDPAAWARGRGLDSPEAYVDALARDILQGPISPETRDAIADVVRPDKAGAPFTPEAGAFDARARGALRLLLASPEFQLA